MRVCVGCGVVGVSTAYLLQRAGASVVALERAAAPGLGASFANGALLHPSYVMPWNEPGIHWKLLRWFGQTNAPLLINFSNLPGYFSWGSTFLAHSTSRRFHDTWMRNLELAKHSNEVMRSIREDTGIDYGHYSRGLLNVYRNKKASPRRTARFLDSPGDIDGRHLARELLNRIGKKLIEFPTTYHQAYIFAIWTPASYQRPV